MSDMTTQTSNLVTLNVGGTRFTTTTETLLGPDTTESIFVPLLSGGFAKEQEVFFDRSPVKFAFILEYLRTGNLDSLPMGCSWTSLAREAKYFGLTNLEVAINEHICDLNHGLEQTFEFEIDVKDATPSIHRISVKANRIDRMVIMEFVGEIDIKTPNFTREVVQIIPPASFLQSPFAPSRNSICRLDGASLVDRGTRGSQMVDACLLWSPEQQKWKVGNAHGVFVFEKYIVLLQFRVVSGARWMYLTDTPMAI